MAEFLDVDPGSLRLPTSRWLGADAVKLARQLARFGTSVLGMPPIWVLRGLEGELMILDGVTRATRVAKFLDGNLVRVEVVDEQLGMNLGAHPTVRERLP